MAAPSDAEAAPDTEVEGATSDAVAATEMSRHALFYPDNDILIGMTNSTRA